MKNRFLRKFAECRFVTYSFQTGQGVSHLGRFHAVSLDSLATHVAASRKRVWTMKAIRRFLRSEDGPTAVEYAVMLALIMLACMSAVVTLVQQTEASYNHSATEINNAITTARGS